MDVVALADWPKMAMREGSPLNEAAVICRLVKWLGGKANWRWQMRDPTPKTHGDQNKTSSSSGIMQETGDRRSHDQSSRSPVFT